MKKLISALLIFTMIIGMYSSVSVPLAYAGSDSNMIYGKCESNIVWNINTETETLTISGKGKMIFDPVQNYGPWVPYRNDFRYVIIEEGITNIKTDAFTGCGLSKLYVPASVEVIEKGALKSTVGNVVKIEFAENSRLRRFEIDSNLKNSTWYENLSNGMVYIGGLLFTYKGTVPAGKNIAIKDGTYAINREAFLNQSNLENITIPDSVERVGKDAFKGTLWYKNQPDGTVYAGNVLYNVKNATGETDASIKAGTVSVAEYAFYNYKYRLDNYVIPASVRYIDDYAYAYAKYVTELEFEAGSGLKEICEGAFCESVIMYYSNLSLPDSVEVIGDGAFYGFICSIDDYVVIEIPLNLKKIGECVFEASSVDKYYVDEENGCFSADEVGVLFNKDKSTLIAAPTCITVKEYVVPETVTRIEISAFSSVTAEIETVILPDSLNEIGAFAFYQSGINNINLPYGIKTIESYTFTSSHIGSGTFFYIPKSVEVIKTRAFSDCAAIRKYVIPDSVNYIATDAFYGRNIDTKIYCYENSTAQRYAENNQIPYVIYKDPDTTELDALLKKYRELDRTNYTETSLEILDAAAENIDLVTTYYTEEQVNGWVKVLSSAFESLVPLPADRTKLESVIKKANSIDRSSFKQEGLAELDKLIAQANEEYSILNQKQVDELTYLINEAIDKLEYLPADYTRVNQAIAESEKLDRLLYSQATLEILDQSIAAVDYTLNITQQAIVDSFADRIYSAISALAYAEVILRNEPNGVVVSATAKVIYPTTALTVDMLDPSNFETANFAVGGYIKSVQYYDINLIRDGVKVQPDGTVSVKIRIPDGVKPEKCRVYHVTDDPVDPLVRFTSTLDGNYIVFETDHFSEFAVIEVENVLSGISVTRMPDKLAYSLGERLDLSGMEITRLMSNGTAEVITDYDVSSVDTTSVGTKTVTVYYTLNEITKSASFEITVSADKLDAEITLNGESINEYNKKVKWYKGYSSESLQLECSLTDSENYSIKWSSDNSKVLVDKNGKVTNKGFFFARRATITLTVTDSAGNVIASDSVTVRFYKFSFQFSDLQALFMPEKREDY